MVTLQLSATEGEQLIQAIAEARFCLTPKQKITSSKQYFIGLSPDGHIKAFPNKSALSAYGALALIEFTLVKGNIQHKAVSVMADERMMSTVRINLTRPLNPNFIS